MNFTGAHILSIEQFERADIEVLFGTADNMEPYAQRRRITRVLEGAILGNMFFEASTRTRISFGSAFNFFLLYTSPSPRDRPRTRIPSSA